MMSMSAQSLSQSGTQVRIDVTIELSHSLPTSEETLHESLNDAGRVATQAALEYLDTDSSAGHVLDGWNDS